MSTHSIEIIEIGEITSHPNADKLCITHVDGWQCCIAKDQFKVGDKAVYIPPDYVCPLSHPSFAFLKKDESKTFERIKVRRLRGQLSQGLLIPVPPELADLPVGTNVIEELGVDRYEPPVPAASGGMFVTPPALYAPKFDIESFQKFMALFTTGEPVVISEKLHGTNSRFTFAQNKDGEWKQFCGTHVNWIAEDDKNWWWHGYRQNPCIGEWCKENPEKLLYGEIFGSTQRNFPYGSKPGQFFFAAFAVLEKDRWLDFDDAFASAKAHNVPWVPILYRGPFDKDQALALAEGPSTYPGAQNIREGCVVVPEKERMDAKIGRVILKIVSNVYLEKH